MENITYLSEFGGNKKFFKRKIYILQDDDYEDNVLTFLEEFNNTDVYKCIYDYTSKDIENCKIIAPLYFDFDGDIDMEYRQVASEVRMVIQYFKMYWKIPPSKMNIYFSGSKGFHLIIPSEVIGISPLKNLNEKFKLLAERVKTRLNCRYLDMHIYDRKRLFRIPCSVNSKSGLYKVPLTYEQLHEFDIEKLKNYASEPHEEPDIDLEVIPRALSEWKRFLLLCEIREIKRKKMEKAHVSHKVAYDGNLLPCIEHLLMNGVQKGQRNNTTAALASSLFQKGWSRKEVFESMEVWNQNNVPPLPEEELCRTISSVARNIENRQYGCTAFKNLELCVEGDCPMKERKT